MAFYRFDFQIAGGITVQNGMFVMLPIFELLHPDAGDPSVLYSPGDYVVRPLVISNGVASSTPGYCSTIPTSEDDWSWSGRDNAGVEPSPSDKVWFQLIELESAQSGPPVIVSTKTIGPYVVGDAGVVDQPTAD